MSENKDKGKLAEQKFKEWLDYHKIQYISFRQDIEAFSPAFKKHWGKRPDFLIIIPYIGTIFVDVKYNANTVWINKDGKECICLDFMEHVKYMVSESQLKTTIWFAISNDNELDFKKWFWIPLSRCFVPEIEERKSDKAKYMPIPKENFIEVNWDDKLSKVLVSELDKHD